MFEEQEKILKKNCQIKKKDDKQITDLKRELSDSKAKGKEDAGQICDLKEKLEAADTELRAVKLKERQNEISMLQKEITTATTVMDLENQLGAMIAGRDQIGGNQIGEMIDTVTELQEDNRQLEAKASGLEHRATTLEAENVSLRQSTKMAHDAIERHENTTDELRKKDGQQKCTLQRLNETIRTLEIEKTATATAAESASCRSQSIQAREDNLKIQHRRAIESLRASSNAHISSLEDQIAGNKRAMAEQKRTLAEYQGDLKRRNLTIGDLQDRISVLQGQLITANTAHADTLSKSESLAKESQRNMATKKTRDMTTQTAIDTLKNETKSKDRQIEALKASSAAAEKHIKTTTSAYDELLKQHGISGGMVARSSAKIEDFEGVLHKAGSEPGSPTQSSPTVARTATNGTGPDEVGEETTASSFFSQQIVSAGLHDSSHPSNILTCSINQPYRPKRNTARSRAHQKAKRQEAKALAEAAASRSSDTRPSDDRFINTNESGGDDKDQESSAEKEVAQAVDQW